MFKSHVHNYFQSFHLHFLVNNKSYFLLLTASDVGERADRGERCPQSHQHRVCREMQELLQTGIHVLTASIDSNHSHKCRLMKRT